jgi:hypothetical protein
MRVIIWMTLALLAGCQQQAATGAAATAAGKERGPCYGNGTCDQGLQCLSDLCVRPAPADCDAIADKLAGLLLGNYTPREERAGFVAQARQDCAAAMLSKEDGACLLRATSRQELGRCPHPLGVGDCARIVAHLQELSRGGGPDQYLVTAADRLISRCKNETPSKALEACALGASTIAELDRCSW